MAVTRDFGEHSDLLAKYPNAKIMGEDDHGLNRSVLYSSLGSDGDDYQATASYEGCLKCHAEEKD